MGFLTSCIALLLLLSPFLLLLRARGVMAAVKLFWWVAVFGWMTAVGLYLAAG